MGLEILKPFGELVLLFSGLLKKDRAEYHHLHKVYMEKLLMNVTNMKNSGRIFRC